MDSMQPVLPAERIRIYGFDGSRDGKTQTTHKKCTKIRILDEQIINQEEGLRWLEGKHPHLGKVITGKDGFETVQKFIRYCHH